MARLKRVYLEDVPQHIIQKFNFTLTPIVPSNTPRIIGTTGGALVQEPVNEAVKNSWDTK